MSEFLPEAVRRGLEAARAAAQRRSGGRLCIHDGEIVHRITRIWEGGFALAAGGDRPVHGRVELFDGPRHLFTCLVVALEDEGEAGERLYEFKSRTPVQEAPPVDYELPDFRPVGLIPRA
jgi:hypothetical protein